MHLSAVLSKSLYLIKCFLLSSPCWSLSRNCASSFYSSVVNIRYVIVRNRKMRDFIASTWHFVTLVQFASNFIGNTARIAAAFFSIESMRFFTGNFEIFLRAMPLPRYASNIIYPVIDQHLHTGNQLLVVFFSLWITHMYTTLPAFQRRRVISRRGGKCPSLCRRVSSASLICASSSILIRCAPTFSLSLHIMSLGKGLCVMHC